MPNQVNIGSKIAFVVSFFHPKSQEKSNSFIYLFHLIDSFQIRPEPKILVGISANFPIR